MNTYRTTAIFFAVTLTFNVSASPLKPQEGRPTIQLDLSRTSLEHDKLSAVEFDISTMGLNLGYEYGLSEILSIKPSLSYGKGLSDDDIIFDHSPEREEISIEIDDYYQLGLQFNLYVPQTSGLLFYAAPSYMKYRISDKRFSMDGFSFELGSAYPLTHSLQFALGVQKGFLDADGSDELDVTSWKLSATYMF